MRVITGSARGRRLDSPEGLDVRPTTDTVKEAIFSIIQFSVEGRSFLDAFSGSGQMGIEALSRGAKDACFLDSSSRSIAVTNKNLRLCGLEENARVIKTDTLSFMRSTDDRFGIVFLDPPYKTGLLEEALAQSERIITPAGIVICEHPSDEELPEAVGGLALKKQYRYGRIRISIYSKREVDGI